MSIDSGTLSRLRWSARRGLLENDLIIERFFNRYAQTLSMTDVLALDQLFDLSDNDLLDLFLGRTKPSGNLDCVEVKQVLQQLQQV
ncbi:MAG: succinate dehydrogenase assembly factor 2 [Betaproteobacteria bacterium]|jgi:antitoxin CptB|nr:succinate dehydrogenase assembly factor 2 [Polynucleobacter sp.]NBY63956.1 succinate dehydrogenase assembly factor 2 [Betaproteobacteria bacterium]